MYKIRDDKSGFGTVEAILIIVIVILIGVVGGLVYKNHHKSAASSTTTSTTASSTKQSASSTPTGTVSTLDGKVSIILPRNWLITKDSNNPNGNQVISVNNNTQICAHNDPTSCGVSGCLDISDPVPCVYEAEFTPSSLANDTNASWSLKIEKTAWTIPQAIYNRIGELTAANTITSNTNSINGYNTEYVVVTGGDCSGECYTDIYYFVENNGYLATFYNREKYINVSINPVNYDYTTYESDFAKIANSIKLNL